MFHTVYRKLGLKLKSFRSQILVSSIHLLWIKQNKNEMLNVEAAKQSNYHFFIQCMYSVQNLLDCVVYVYVFITRLMIICLT